MKRIKNDIDEIMSLQEKERILKELKQEELINLFKNGYQHQYKKIEPKKQSLDQQISITISADEKDFISKELTIIRRTGPSISLSSFIRNRTSTLVDVNEWGEIARNALLELKTSAYNPNILKKEKYKYVKLIDDLEENDENFYYYKEKIEEIDTKLATLKRRITNRRYRITCRVTYQEANIIRWRAARLSLPIADYMRFVLFGYTPFSDGDSNMSLEARKRFYVSILDVAQNGWGSPPEINECANCQRHLEEIEKLKETIKRYEMLFHNM